MSYTIQDYQREYVRDHLNLLPTEEVLNRYSAEEVLKRYSADDLLDKLSPDILKAMMQKIVQH